MIKINKNFPCNSNNYGNKRNTSDIKYIVIHYTGNNNDKAVSNCKYFQSPNRNASAHYFVDENEIYQSVEDNIIAWSVGGNKYPNCNQTGGGKYYGICTNKNSISIEMCNSVKTVPEKTKKLVKELINILMQKYHIPATNIIRHFDVNGKCCPASLIDNNKWTQFKNELIANNSISILSDSPIKEIKILLDNQEVKVHAINIDNCNYIKLKDLENEKIKITYDTNKKMPVVNIK